MSSRSRAKPSIRWTPQRDEIFTRLWPVHGASWEGWRDELGLSFQPSPNQLYARASTLRVNRKRGVNPYSDEEERELERLIDWYCERHNRTVGSVARKVSAIYQRRRQMALRESKR